MFSNRDGEDMYTCSPSVYLSTRWSSNITWQLFGSISSIKLLHQ